MIKNQKDNYLLPPAKLGILGGGQLGMLFTMAAKNMGYRVIVVDPDIHAPAQMFADKHICKPYDDIEVLHELKQCAAITVEFENVSVELMQKLEETVRVSPSARCVAISQNRIDEKNHIRKAGLATVPFKVILSEKDIHEDCLDLLPGILKTATLGYDGKGQIRVDNLSFLKQSFNDLHRIPCILEKRVALRSEASIIVCRLNDEAIQCFSIVDNVHVNGILFTSSVPSSLSDKIQEKLQKQAIQLAKFLNFVGVMAVEFFIVDDDIEVYVNEIAPRPHNSGHYTLDATLSSQFQQQVRILCGFPPLSTELLRPCTMVNILGDLWRQHQEPCWEILLAQENIHLHLYGKRQAKIGRKMGHYTVLSPEVEKSRVQALSIFSQLIQQAENGK